MNASLSKKKNTDTKKAIHLYIRFIYAIVYVYVYVRIHERISHNFSRVKK